MLEVCLHLPRPGARRDVAQAARGPVWRVGGADGLDVLGHHGRGIAPGAVAYGAGVIIPGSCGIGPLLGIGTSFTGFAEFGD